MDIIRVPIGYIISLCYKLIPNYVFALLLFALIMKLILFPLGIKQQKSTVKQAKLRPKEQAIRNRYAGRTDKATQQKMQQDIMKLYQDENYNPAGGCLPMILQLVIIMALYGVVMNPLRYVSQVKAENIDNVGIKMVVLHSEEKLNLDGVNDNIKKLLDDAAKKVGEDGSTEDVKNVLSGNYGIYMVSILKNNDLELFKGDGMLDADFTKDDLPDFTVFGGSFDLSKSPSINNFDWLMIIPLITFITTFGSMKLNKKLTYQPAAPTGDAAASMVIMDYAMPLMSTFFTFSVPAVIAVYWIYQNIFSTLQQFVLKLIYPYPTFSEEDYKEAEREMNKGLKQSKKSQKKAAKKAAHRIDLDDGEEEATTEQVSAPKGKKSDLLPPAALKDESDKNN